jgi:uncharacterized protein YgbK (DUF1537 family)
MAPALGIIADDYTGAVMVAGLLETAGVHCPVIFDPSSLRANEAAPILMTASRSRTVSVAEAIGQVSQLAGALSDAGCARLAYKACASFDSTADGNIGPAADLLAERATRRPVLMSAGFPRFGATVHQGYLFYRGRLVSESIKRLDPLTPMDDPDLVRFLGKQTPKPIALIPHSILRQGADRAHAELERLAAGGAGHVLCDASDDGDVEISAEIARRSGLPVAASDPLVIELARKLAEGAPTAPPPPALPRGPLAVIAGSTGPVVMAQLACFAKRYPVLTLDLLAGSPAVAQIESALAWAMRQQGPFAISTACDAAGLARSQGAFGPLGAARQAETLLGGIAKGLRGSGFTRFVVAGGETSGAVVTALGISRARALAEGPLGVGFCVSEESKPVLLYLKPGKLGADDVLLCAAED